MAKLAKILVLPTRAPKRTADSGVDPGAGPVVDPAAEERRARWVVLALIAGALGLFWAGVSLRQHQNLVELGALSGEARRGLYTRTLEELQTVCRDPAAAAGALREHCEAQAIFALQFPECTADCRRAATLVLPHARR